MLGIVGYSESSESEEEADISSPKNVGEDSKNPENDEAGKIDVVVTNAKETEQYNDERDSETDSDIEIIHPKQDQLPLPNAFVNETSNDGYPKKRRKKTDHHSCRKRTFEHVEGNWATYMYVPVQPSDNYKNEYEDIIKCLRLGFPDGLHVFPMDSCHISVSRTVPIRHYWIEPMFDKLKMLLKGMQSFSYSFSAVKVYTNDEKTRTFVGLEISQGYERFTDLIKRTDQIYADFNLVIRGQIK